MEDKDIIESQGEKEVLESIKSNRIVIPMLLGVGVIFYLVWSSFEIEEFKAIKWGGKVITYTSLAILTYALRHLVLSYRLKLLSNDFFGWNKSIELSCIWEFASAVSPTSLGGSAVALFFLAQEKLSAAKTVTLVLYTVIADSIFFMITLPILFFTLGPISIRPEAILTSDLGVYWPTIIVIYIFIVFYGSLFIAGIFRPQIMQRIIRFFGKLPFLNRWQDSIYKTADDMVTTSRELRKQPIFWHIKVFISTFINWFLRFFTINFIVLGLTGLSIVDVYDQCVIYARSEMMHSITQFSPTPGGAGVTEFLFGGFYSDYISSGISSFVALIWRLVTYYTYLFIGLLIIPNWIRKIWIRRKRDSRKKTTQSNA